jgi:putative redox protein
MEQQRYIPPNEYAMNTAKVKYLGELRTQITHLRSGSQLITDAPVDNQGKGEAFSPSDLLASALASCMLTIMGIAARERGLLLDGLEAEVIKHMQKDPRQVARIEVRIRLSGATLGPKERSVLERIAHTCPVARSLRADLEQDVTFEYQ